MSPAFQQLKEGTTAVDVSPGSLDYQLYHGGERARLLSDFWSGYSLGSM